MDWATLALTLVSALAALTGLTAAWFTQRTRITKIREADRKIKEITLELADKFGDMSDLPILVSTSAAHAPSGVVQHEVAIRDLRAQVDRISEEVKSKTSEIVEVQKIDPVLEATLKGSIDNLTKRIEALEKNLLSKWDVATVVLQLVGGMGVIIGIVFGIIKFLSS